MKILKRLFTKEKKEEKSINDKNNSIKKNFKSNPAFNYVQGNYGIDCELYRKLSSSIYNHSVAAADEFADIINKKSNEDLTHFFFDYFLSFYVSAKQNNFPENKDSLSALIDGMHIEHYGNVSQQIIDSTLSLMATTDMCFLKTHMKLQDDKDKYRLLITIASYCIDRTNILGATEVLPYVEPFRQIQNSKLSSIDTFFEIYKN